MNKNKVLGAILSTAMIFGAANAHADHNSKFGAGTAKMPNDIHNMRVMTKEIGNNELFRDFVKYGNGARSINRYSTESTTSQNGAGGGRGKAPR